jgi:peroxiredoxin
MKAYVIAFVLLGAACAHRSSGPTQPVSLAAVDGTDRAFVDLVSHAPWTVVVFVSAECPCMSAHHERLRELASAYESRGVAFLAVDSEVGTTPAIASAQAGNYPFPLLIDRGARLADELGAEYATYTVIVDRNGHIRYRGGIDSDKQRLHANATPYVRDALDDLLAGRDPRRPEGKTLGCVLRRW